MDLYSSEYNQEMHEHDINNMNSDFKANLTSHLKGEGSLFRKI